MDRKTAIEVEISESQSGLMSRNDEIQLLRQQYEEVMASIASSENLLTGSIEPEFEGTKSQLDGSKQRLEAIRSRIETLYGKQGRGMQFKTKESRNKFLQTQIDNLRGQVRSKTAFCEKSSKEISNEEQRLYESQSLLEKLDAQKKAQSSRYEEVVQLIQQRVRERNELQESRKNIWRDLETIQEQIHDAKQDLEKGNQILNGSLPRHITQGLAVVEQIAQENNITGYFGPIIDNFELKSDKFQTAVEVAVGNALFHVIVETDEIAAYLMQELEQRRAGRLTFLPLNRLRPPNVTYPETTDAYSLIDIALNYDPEFEVAIRHVFGRNRRGDCAPVDPGRFQGLGIRPAFPERFGAEPWVPPSGTALPRGRAFVCCRLSRCRFRSRCRRI